MSRSTWRIRAALGLGTVLLVWAGRPALAQERDRDQPSREDRDLRRGEERTRWRFNGGEMDRWQPHFRMGRSGPMGRAFRFRGPRDFAFQFRAPVRMRGYGAGARDWGRMFDGRDCCWERFDRDEMRERIRDRVRERLRSRPWRR